MKLVICLGAVLGALLFAQACSGSDTTPADSLDATKDKGENVSKLAAMNTPIFWAEGHPGRLDQESWKVQVTGACEAPKTFTWKEIQEMPQSEVTSRLTSVTRWSVKGNWKGVPLSAILDAVEMKPSCKYVRFWSVGGIYDTSIPVDIALKEKSLLAHSFDGEFLDEDYGGPVRAFIPYLWGYKSAKSVIKIELMEYYVPGFWEKRGYTDSGEVEAGPCRDINAGGEIKQIKGPGEVEF
ncbi:MAG: molybdopterin-dependent oxidoreductase [Candidatus Syntrophosphaera sp.]